MSLRLQVEEEYHEIYLYWIEIALQISGGSLKLLRDL